jgi:dolichyl-diphosphooligosaccharide---protein glycosyltransferase
LGSCSIVLSDGYQITGIGNRTTIADGNTWNHEHIALLGRILTSPEKESHRIARHLADYVLVWTGGGGDDVAKSPHLRRIANSVYRGLCREPTCSEFGFYVSSVVSSYPRLSCSFLLKLLLLQFSVRPFTHRRYGSQSPVQAPQ